MKKWLWITLAVAMMCLWGLNGCKEETADEMKSMETHMHDVNDEHPASDIPKDHPAH